MGIDAKAMGRRIAQARTRAGLTQADVAAVVGLDRSAVAKIESGARRVSALELARLADALDLRIEWFVMEGPPAIVSRRNADHPATPNPRIDAVIERVAREVEFVVEHDERLALTTVLPQPVPAHSQEAEALAATARTLLGITQHGPCAQLAEKVAACGLLAFSLDLGDESADAATMLLREGGVALVNGRLRVGRRRLALAHELGHYLVADDYTVDPRVADFPETEHRELLLDRFARAFLLPRESLRSEWSRFTAGIDGDVRTAAVRLASSYRVDMATLARRLLELELADHEDADRVRSTRTTRADIVELDLVVGEELVPPALPRAYERAVLRLFRSESISVARALDLLFDTWDDDSLPELPRRNEDEIWRYV